MAGDNLKNLWRAHRRPYRAKSVLVILLVLLALAVLAVEGRGQNDDGKGPPLRQQMSEQDFRYAANANRMAKRLRERAEMTRQKAKMLKKMSSDMYEDAERMDEEADELEAKEPEIPGQTLRRCDTQDQPKKEEDPGTAQKFKLKFNGSLQATIFKNDSLEKYSNGGPIEIAIYRGDQIITSGEFSSLSVEIVALRSDHSCKGEWTEEDFDRQIERIGQGRVSSVLHGEAIVQLAKGKGSLVLPNLCFKACGGGFVLAARVCSSANNIGPIRVEEAFMDPPFSVKTERSKGNQKLDIPELGSEVYLLKGIKKDGEYHKRLKSADITTVRDFLKALNESPQKIRQILGIKQEKNTTWRDMVGHARMCNLGDNVHRLKSFASLHEKIEITLFFNCVHDLVGADFGGNFVAKGNFSNAQQIVVDDLLQPGFPELKDTFDYIMEGNRPVHVHAHINTAGSPSAPISGVGQNRTTEGYHNTTNDFSVSDVPEAGGVTGTDRLYILDLSEQGENHHPERDADKAALEEMQREFESALESEENNPALDSSSGGNFNLSRNPNCDQDQAAGNLATTSGNEPCSIPNGDANGNDARYSAPEPSCPDHRATFQGENHHPEGDAGNAALEELQRKLASDLEEKNPALYSSSGGNFNLLDNPTWDQYQGMALLTTTSGNDRANRNDARYSAPESSCPDHQATFQAAAVDSGRATLPLLGDASRDTDTAAPSFPPELSQGYHCDATTNQDDQGQNCDNDYMNIFLNLDQGYGDSGNI